MKRLESILQHPLFRETLSQLEILEADRIYCRHDLSHLLDVARAAWILCLERSLPLQKDLVYAAALLHDIGRAAQYTAGIPHREAGVPIAKEILQDSSFSPQEQACVLDCVQQHGAAAQGDALCTVIAEADHKTRPCFACQAASSCKWPMEERNVTLVF